MQEERFRPVEDATSPYRLPTMENAKENERGPIHKMQPLPHTVDCYSSMSTAKGYMNICLGGGYV